MSLITVWVVSGLFYLIYMSVQDIKNDLFVDEKYNYIMIGLSISLVTLINSTLYYLGLLVGIIAFVTILKRFGLFGSADLGGFLWLLTGWGMVNLTALVVFVCALLFFTVAFFGLNNILVFFKMKPKEAVLPYMPVIFLTHLFTTYVFWFFLVH